MQDIMLYVYKIQIFLLLKANHISFSFKILDKNYILGLFTVAQLQQPLGFDYKCFLTVTRRPTPMG